MIEETLATDLGTPELRNHALVEVKADAEGHRRAYNRTQVPVDYYHVQGFLAVGGEGQEVADRRLRAANAFYRLWYYGSAKVGSLAQARMSPLPKGEPNWELISEAQSEYSAAKASMRSLVAQLICYNVVCLGEWAKDLSHCGVGINRRMSLLRDGLDDLATHFETVNRKK